MCAEDNESGEVYGVIVPAKDSEMYGNRVGMETKVRKSGILGNNPKIFG